MDEKSRTRTISFAQVGKREQHSVTLFAIAERDFDLEEAGRGATYAIEAIDHYRERCEQLLEASGIELGHSLYVVDAGRVVPFREGTHRNIDAQPLALAIKERDAGTGQNAQFLAAMILRHIDAAMSARQQIMLNRHGAAHHDAVLDNCMLAQTYFFDLILLDAQSKYSAGTARIDAIIARKSKRAKYECEARELLVKLLSEGKSKERSYKHVAVRLKKTYGKCAPSENTIKIWLKGDKSLRPKKIG
jgi:hypothetical protein